MTRRSLRPRRRTPRSWAKVRLLPYEAPFCAMMLVGLLALNVVGMLRVCACILA